MTSLQALSRIMRIQQGWRSASTSGLQRRLDNMAKLAPFLSPEDLAIASYMTEPMRNHLARQRRNVSCV